MAFADYWKVGEVKDTEKTRAQLMEDLTELRQRVIELGAAEAERKQAEETLKKAQTNELTQMASHQAALLDISQAVQAIEHIDDLERVVRVMFEQMKTIGLDFSGLAFQRLIDAKTQTFEQYHVRPDGTYLKQVDPRPATFGEWHAQQVLYRRDLSLPEHREGLPDDFQLPYQGFGLNIRCILHVPNRYGVLTLRSETPHAFSDAQVGVIGDLAEMLGLGISRVEDLERLEERNAELARANASLEEEITERKRAEDALRESEERFRRLSDASFEAIVITEKGIVLDVNDRFIEMFGCQRSEVIGAEVMNFVAPESRALVADKVASRDEEPYEHMALRRDGSVIPVEVHGKTMPFEGRTVRVTAIRDISERKRLEQELIHTQRLRAAGELSAGVSHNLNNILTGVLGPAQMLKLSTDDPEALRETDLIIASTLRARDLVHRLHLSTRGIEEGRLEAMPVNDVILEAIQAARPRWKDESEARGVSIDVITELEDVPPILGTESRLHDILMNLLFNAVDAMPGGGAITIRSRSVGNGVQLTVSDTGVGMDEDTRRRVFEPFFTTKMDVGSGLGLSTVYGTVNRWGGSIDVQSEPGRGARFTLRLPICAQSRVEHAQKRGIRQVRRANILIVEDDEIVCQVLSHLLEEHHTVQTLYDGRKALEAFTLGRFDVVIIDLGIPGMPGDQLLQEVRKSDSVVSAVLITGWELDNDDSRVSAFDFRIQKPFADLVEVANVVAHAVELHDRRAEGGRTQGSPL